MLSHASQSAIQLVLKLSYLLWHMIGEPNSIQHNATDSNSLINEFIKLGSFVGSLPWLASNATFTTSYWPVTKRWTTCNISIA